jgi:hypothetical protein
MVFKAPTPSRFHAMIALLEKKGRRIQG